MVNFSFAVEYFNVYSSPFEVDGTPNLPRKKIKTEKANFEFSDVDVVIACYQLLQSAVDFFRRKWDWSVFIKKYLDHSDVTIKWCVLFKK